MNYMDVFPIPSSDLIEKFRWYIYYKCWSYFRFIDQDTLCYSSSSAPLKLKSQPKAVAHEDDLTAVVTLDSIHLIKNGSIVQEEKVDYEPSCVSISKDQQSLAVGDAGQGMWWIKIVR